MGRIKAILFDYGHTLVNLLPWETYLPALQGELLPHFQEQLNSRQDWNPLLERAVYRVMEDYEGSYQQRGLRELDVFALYRQAFAQEGLTLPPPLLERAVACDHALFARTALLRTETMEALWELKRRGLRLGIVSNLIFVPPGIHRFPLLEPQQTLFDVIVLSSQIGVRKPHASIYERALEALGLPAKAVLFVGDRIREDVRGPKALGFPLAFLSHEFRQEPDAHREADALLERLADLPQLLS